MSTLSQDDEVVFRHACKLGLEGIVSKRKDSPLSLRSGLGYQGGVHPGGPLRRAVARRRAGRSNGSGRFAELLMFTEPKFGLWNRLCETRDHLGSLECRVRNDDAECTRTDERESEGHDHSDGELRDMTAHV
jgi:hypothetical protein